MCLPLPRFLLGSFACMLALVPAHADEGMWMPQQLPQLAQALTAAGFAANVDEFADVAHPPLRAVVRAGGGTGAFVSKDGLLLTNHHVAYGIIQYNTRADANLIENGFIAMKRADELPANPDFQVLVTVGFDEVTQDVLDKARGLTGRAYFDAVEAANKQIVAECEKDRNVRCSVSPFNYGQQFYRITQLPLRDVRLVYAPPRAIGNYGDEVDNFMWPRHTGDFALLRAYVSRTWKPAAYHRNNIPYNSQTHLQITTEGVREGDFVMLAGYPGSTFRHRSAAEFHHQVERVLPQRVALLDELINIVQTIAQRDGDVYTRYAAQLQSLKNNRKRAAGELEGLLRSEAVRQRDQDEARMWNAWRTGPGAATDKAEFEAAINAALANNERDQTLAQIVGMNQLLSAAVLLERLRVEAAKPDAERTPGYQERDHPQMEGFLHQMQRRYAPEVEKAVLGVLLARYQALPDAVRVPEYDQVFGRTREAAQEAIEQLYAHTRLGDERVRLAALAAIVDGKPPVADVLLTAAAQLVQADLRLEDVRKANAGELLRLRPTYMNALAHWRRQQGRELYPDANGTLRVSYGHVEGLTSRDALRYAPVSTVAGIVEKNTGHAPFNAPAPLLDAIARRNFTGTEDRVLGTQPVNFLTNLDTTGGNSGSPVLNARGQLVGLNFDSNWESVSASWWFDPRYKRAIHVDMRYFRWLLDKVYPAHHLLKEMKLLE